MTNQKIISTIILTLLLLIACSDGSDDPINDAEISLPTDPNKLFSLAVLNSTAIGSVYSFQLTGSDSNDVTYSGLMSAENRALEMFAGVLVTPRDSIINLTSEGSSVTITNTSYSDSNGNLVGAEFQTFGVECTALSVGLTPNSVKIGDFGVMSTLICSDNSTVEHQWVVYDAKNGKIDVVTTVAFSNQSEPLKLVTYTAYTLNGSSDLIRIRVVEETKNFVLRYETI